MPTFSSETADAPDRPVRRTTAQTFAISAISQHPSPAAGDYLRSLLNAPRFAENELLLDWTRASLKQRENRLAAHEKRQEAQRIKDTRNESSARIEGPVEEIPATSPAPEVEETVQEVTAPKPATEEPDEITPVKMAEESPEQSSQWWLWLVGALVVVGGLGMLLRRKS